MDELYSAWADVVYEVRLLIANYCLRAFVAVLPKRRRLPNYFMQILFAASQYHALKKGAQL